MSREPYESLSWFAAPRNLMLRQEIAPVRSPTGFPCRQRQEPPMAAIQKPTQFWYVREPLEPVRLISEKSTPVRIPLGSPSQSHHNWRGSAKYRTIRYRAVSENQPRPGSHARTGSPAWDPDQRSQHIRKLGEQCEILDEAAIGMRSWCAMYLPNGTWQPVHPAPTVEARAGVYVIRIVDRNRRRPWSISRLLDMDPEGVLSIGQSSNLERRRRGFVSGVTRCYGHSEGNLLHLVARHAHRADKFGKDLLSAIEWRFQYVHDTAAAKAHENTLLKQYIRRFGEPPPLNSAIPDRYGAW